MNIGNPALRRQQLGTTGILVSRLCFGTLVMGVLQRNLTPDEGGTLLADAYRSGVNFVDTAELYGTYAHIRASIRQSGLIPVVASKCYAWTADGAKRSVEKALRETGLPAIDIFLLHEQESAHTLRGHAEALEALVEMKRQGMIRAVGVSTHHIACVRAASAMAEIDVIHPIINRAGLGICDGTSEEMIFALEGAHRAGKGLYGMKVLGGGNLLAEYPACLQYALDIPWLQAIAIGMQHRDELMANLAAFRAWESGSAIPYPSGLASNTPKKALHVDFWCEGCGRCVTGCGHGALSLREGKADPDPARCVLCGYCAAVCPVFALKVY